jgi:hypothetical protein
MQEKQRRHGTWEKQRGIQEGKRITQCTLAERPIFRWHAPLWWDPATIWWSARVAIQQLIIAHNQATDPKRFPYFNVSPKF